jgi:hypothetical protein
MAVYQGARPRAGIALPWLGRDPDARRAPDLDVRSRERPSAATRDRRRSASRISSRPIGRTRRVGVILAGIVVAFSVAFLSLSQSVRVAATSYDIVRLVSEHDRLAALQQDMQSNVDRLRGEPAIRKESLDHGLGQLGPALVLPAR